MGQIEALLDAYNPKIGIPRTYLHIVLEQDRLEELGAADGQDFKALLGFVLDEIGIRAETFEQKYRIDRPTLEAWRDGTCTPHPTLQALVRKDLYERLTQELTRA